MLVERGLVRDHDPLGPLELLHVEDLAVDIERRLAARQPPLVAGDDELAHLLPERSVLPAAFVRFPLGVEREQAAHLRLDVDAGLAAAHLTLVPRLDELPNLGLAFDLRDRAPGSWRRPRR